MIDIPPRLFFQPHSPDSAGVISWAHIGDLHMTLAGEQNHLDLLAIVEELNESFARSLAFVFLPGDVADHGSADEYGVVRQALDDLHVPWCSILGDHDVHTKSYAHYRQYMSAQTHYSFAVGKVRFFALNAFDRPDPGSFILLSDQLVWLEEELRAMRQDESAVLFLHCYPTELKQGGGKLRELIARYPVRLVEMGHTHYNEISNDGRTLYAATRSTGQIEEGPVGYSITSLDGPAVSWKFLPLGDMPCVMITFPADERLLTDADKAEPATRGELRVRAKIWSTAPVRTVVAKLGRSSVPLTQVQGSSVWEGTLSDTALPEGVHPLSVDATDESGRQATDTTRVVIGASARTAAGRSERDLENALAAWPEHGLLGTQLGPNKNGKKW